MQNISILNLGIGNIASVVRMVDKVGGNPIIITKKEEIRSAEKLILPGVGSFDVGMQQIGHLGLTHDLVNRIKIDKIPVLGICLGMQLLCRRSEEGREPGLGVIAADVVKFQRGVNHQLKIPHMGWNTFSTTQENSILPYTQIEQRFYFVHSYYVKPDDENIMIGATDYGGVFCSAFQKNNVFGVQFHPEKSHKFGLAVMSRFIGFQIPC